MSDVVQRYLEWTISEIQKWENYHNHKETMAWTATAFYITGVVTVGFILSNAPVIDRALVTLGVLIVGYLIWIFINMQFRMRWLSADFQKGLIQFAADLCSSSVELPDKSEFKVDQEKRFPDHIYIYINQVTTCRNNKIKAVKNMLLQRADLDDRWKTELPSYGLVIIATITVIISLWL